MTEAIEPPSGLGNFKGVMLCTRPEDQPQGDKGPAPFKSTVAPTYGEQVGLPPAKSDEPQQHAAPPPRTEAVVRHAQWLKQLQAQMNAQRSQGEKDEAAQAQQAQNVKEFCERQREEVRKLREECKEKGVEPDKKQLMRALKGKPAWAKSKDESAEADLEDIPELLDFAENLNFDEYINDLEFREAMCAIRGRANRLGKEQLAYHEKLCEQFNACPTEGEQEDTPIEEAAIEGSALGDGESLATSYLTGSKRSDRSSEWDSTTCTSETRTVMSEERSMAEQVLELNPALKKVHSVASMQKVIEKTKAEKPEKGIEEDGEAEAAKQRKIEKLMEALKKERAPPAPVIQVTEEVQRTNKPVDPSMLPYLYRSPAV